MLVLRELFRKKRQLFRKNKKVTFELIFFVVYGGRSWGSLPRHADWAVAGTLNMENADAFWAAPSSAATGNVFR